MSIKGGGVLLEAQRGLCGGAGTTEAPGGAGTKEKMQPLLETLPKEQEEEAEKHPSLSLAPALRLPPELLPGKPTWKAVVKGVRPQRCRAGEEQSMEVRTDKPWLAPSFSQNLHVVFYKMGKLGRSFLKRE